MNYKDVEGSCWWTAEGVLYCLLIDVTEKTYENLKIFCRSVEIWKGDLTNLKKEY